MNDPRSMHLFDPSFQSQLSGKCDLLIRISNDTLSYAIVDQVQDQLKVIFSKPVKQSPDKALEDLLENEPFFKFHYRKIKVSIQTTDFSLIPTEIFQDANVPLYSQLFTPDKSDPTVTTLRTAKVKNITLLDTNLKNLIKTKWPTSLVFSQAEPFIESSLKYYLGTNDAQLFLQINNSTFEAVVSKDQTLQFYNIFSNETADEFNYFLLLLIDQLGIDPQKTDVILSGLTAENDDRYTRIQKYFKNIYFSDSRKLIRISAQFDNISAHQFFSLIALNICE